MSTILKIMINTDTHHECKYLCGTKMSIIFLMWGAPSDIWYLQHIIAYYSFFFFWLVVTGVTISESIRLHNWFIISHLKARMAMTHDLHWETRKLGGSWHGKASSIMVNAACRPQKINLAVGSGNVFIDKQENAIPSLAKLCVQSSEPFTNQRCQFFTISRHIKTWLRLMVQAKWYRLRRQRIPFDWRAGSPESALLKFYSKRLLIKTATENWLPCESQENAEYATWNRDKSLVSSQQDKMLRCLLLVDTNGNKIGLHLSILS
jgi:hypothetical protein